MDFDSVNYFTEPISKAKIKELLAKMGVSARHILRTSDPAFKRLNLVAGNLSENAIINLMVNHPELLQRPIVEKGKQAILARPAERIRELFQ